jgi:hypothetical protein
MTTQSKPYRLRVYGYRVRAFKTLGAALRAFRALGAIRDGAWAVLLNGEVLFS